MTTKEKLIEVIQYFLWVYSKQPSQISIFVAEVSRGFIYHATSRGKDNFTKLFRLCQDIIEQGQENNTVRKDIQANYLTYFFLGSLDATLSVMILGDEPLNDSRKKRITDSLVQVFFQGAAPLPLPIL
ncbi:MAG: hypothetical protein L7F78_24715 [Syntrophales bacterium LBB04]|nr:hypothetical protein [Syntrophales bacterium LBB04]